MADYLTRRPELLADAFGLFHERVKDDVFLTLFVNEIATPDFRRRLKLAIDASVALFEPRWVPGQIDMDEVMAAHLKIDALTRRIGADQNSKRLLSWVRVESAFQLLATVGWRRAGEGRDTLVGPR